MTSSKIHWDLTDKGGRRTGADRRCFCYSCHIPERRCGADRRTNKDRLSDLDIIPFLGFVVAPDEQEIDFSAALN